MFRKAEMFRKAVQLHWMLAGIIFYASICGHLCKIHLLLKQMQVIAI